MTAIDVKVAGIKDQKTGTKMTLSGVIPDRGMGAVEIDVTAKGHDLEAISEALGIESVGYGKKLQIRDIIETEDIAVEPAESD